MDTVVELGQQLEQKRGEYKAKFEGYPLKKMSNGQEAPVISAEGIAELRGLMGEINEISAKFDAARATQVFYEENNGAMERKYGKPTNRPEFEGKDGEEPEKKDFFTRMFEQAESKGGLRKGLDMEVKMDPRLEFKTTMSNSAGYAPFSQRSDVLIPTVQIKPTLMDYLPIIPVDQNSYKFVKETTFTNNAGVKAEGTAFDEAALAATETTVTMERCGVYIPVTEDQLQDVPGARAYLEDRLRAMVKIKAEAQMLTGNGTPPQWNGITALSNIQSVDASTFGSKFDAVFRAILRIGQFDATTYGGALPNLVVLNPADWEDLVTMRDADGRYILQNPGDSPMQRVWGLPVVQNFTLASGTGLVLDTSFFPIGLRRDIRVAISDSHDVNFTKGILTVRVDLKGNVISYRDAAAAKITNL